MYSDTYKQFEKEYRAFCGTKGLCLDHLPVNLRHLYTLACKHSNLTRDTPLDTWDGVSKGVTAGFLPGQTLREQYCMYLEGFHAYTACVNNNAVSSSSPVRPSKQQASSPQQMLCPPCKQSTETAGQDQKPRTKLPAKHQKLVQELHRRRGIAAVVPPACPPTAPSPAAPVTNQQHTCTADSPSDSNSPAAKPSEVVTELVSDAAKQALVASPAQVATALPVRAGRQVKKPVRHGAAARQVPAAPKPAQPAAPAAARPPPGRRSRRVHNQVRPAGFVDSSIIVTESSSSNSESDEGSESDGSSTDTSDGGHGGIGSKCPWKLGPAYQAALPQLQQLPQGGPRPAEAKYLRQPVFTPVDPGASSSSGSRPNTGITLGPGVFRKMWDEAATGPARVQLLEGWLNKMDQNMGQQLAQSLGLSRLGSKLRATWAPHEEILFALGMLDKYRKFRYIKRCYLPRRSVHQLNSYYYNVWKNRAGPVPEEYTALNQDPNGDGPAWRRQLCERLAAMWDHQSMGPIPTLAQQDPTAAAAAAAAAVVAKQQAVTAAVAEIRSVAAAKASVAKNFSNSRGSSVKEPADAAACVKAVVVVKAPLTAAHMTPAVAAARNPAVTISAATVSTESSKQQTTNSGAGGMASAAAVAAGIIARLTATAAASGSLTKPSAAAQAGTAAGARQQSVSGIRGGGRSSTGAAVPAGLSGMKLAEASISSCRPGAVTTVQQPTAQHVGRLMETFLRQVSGGMPKQKAQQSGAAARYTPQSAPRAPQVVAQDVQYGLAQQQPQRTPAAPVGGEVQQPQQHRQKVSNPDDSSRQQISGTQSGSGSESDSAASNSSAPSSSRSCSGSQSHSDPSDNSSGSGSQQKPGNGNGGEVQSDAGCSSGSPSAGATAPSSDGAGFGSQGDDAVADPLASMLHSSPGRKRLRSGASDASGSGTGNTTTSSGSSESFSSSDSGASSRSSSEDASDDESSECVSRGKRLAVEKSFPDGSPSVVVLTSSASDLEDGCHPADRHRQQQVARSRKRRRSGSRGSGATGGSVVRSEDSDGVICISD